MKTRLPPTLIHTTSAPDNQVFVSVAFPTVINSNTGSPIEYADVQPSTALAFGSIFATILEDIKQGSLVLLDA